MDELLNWLWQGCAVTVVATVLLHARQLSAATRYWLWWSTLVLVLTLPVAPTLSLASPSGIASAETAVINVAIPVLPDWPLTVALFAWAVWVAGSVWRATAALVSLLRAKRGSRPFPIEREKRLTSWMSVRAEGRRARLVISDQIRSAAVLGLTSPVIAVAPALMCELDDRELDQVLVHEWAHVQRRDDITCFLQVLIHAVAGLHPAVWWIDRRLKIEREAACDDWVVRLTGSFKGYASCLTRLAGLHADSTDTLLVPGALSGPALTTRVMRLLDPRRNASPQRSLAALALTMPLLLALVLLAASVQLGGMVIPAIPPLEIRASRGPVTSVPSVAADTGNRSPRPMRRVPSERRQPRTGALDQLGGQHRSPVAAPLAAAVDVGSAAQSNVAVPNQNGFRSTLEPSLTLLTELPGATVHAPAAPPKDKAPAPWSAAADAGVSVGRGSQKAAVATAGFFTRVGKSIAGVF